MFVSIANARADLVKDRIVIGSGRRRKWIMQRLDFELSLLAKLAYNILQ